MNRLDQFLNVAAHQMRIMPTAKRDDELRELRGHLEQRAEDYRGAGMSDDAAQARALEGLGSPRKLGASLCDAWEGIEFSWWRLAAAIIGVTLLYMVGQFYQTRAFIELYFWPQGALIPNFVGFLLFVGYFPIALSCGVTLSLLLGRRGKWVCAGFFIAMGIAGLVSPSYRLFFWGIMQITVSGVSCQSLPLSALLAFGAAIICDTLRFRKLKLATATGGGFCATKAASNPSLKIGAKRILGIALTCLLAAWGIHIYKTLHPSTPEATLHNYLILNRQMNIQDFEPPKILAMSELPEQSSAEIAGQQKRVWFKIEERMTPSYKARRVAYLKQLLKAPKQQQPFEDEALRQSLARLQRNRQITQGVTTLVKTPKGWKVDAKNAPSLGDWAYDLAYRR